MDRAAILAVTALALILGSACSDHDEPAAVSTTTATAVSTTTETTEFLSVAECVSTGDPTVEVPDVIGERLRDAIQIVEESRLTVIDDEGVPEGDPVGATAVVWAQKPAGGEFVPPGACVGFRTRD
jgi:beta-lactam-binding protein with PASTA domain